MTDTAPLDTTTASLWTSLSPYVASAGRKLGTLVAGALIAHGAVTSGQSSQIIEIVSGVVVYAAMQALSWVSIKYHIRFADVENRLLDLTSFLTTNRSPLGSSETSTVVQPAAEALPVSSPLDLTAAQELPR